MKSLLCQTGNRNSVAARVDLQCLDLVVVDTETTGFSYKSERVIEIGAVKIQGGEIVDEFQTLVNSVDWVPLPITAFTGISTEMIQKDGVAPEDVYPKFREFIGGSIFVGHNVYFDFHFLNGEFTRYHQQIMKNNRICTCITARKALPELKNHKLTTLKEVLGLDLRSHRALFDAKMSWEVLKKFSGYAKIYDKPIDEGMYRGISDVVA